MYDNVMIHLSKEEADKKIAELKDNSSVFTVVLDGEKIPYWRNYIRIVEKEYRFPTKNDNFDGYYDWMCDLSWLGKKTVTLCLYSISRNFLLKTLTLKTLF